MRIRIRMQEGICVDAFDGDEGAAVIAEMTDLPAKIRQIRKSLGLNQAEFGELVGVHQSTISKWEKGDFSQKPKLENIKKLAMRANVSLTELAGADLQYGRVPVIGFISQGAEMILFSDTGENEYSVTAPDGLTEQMVAVEIRTDDLGPVFTNWFVFYDNEQLPPTDELLGKFCVIGLRSGKIVAKTLMKGQLPGCYNLVPMIGPPSYDVAVSWAAKVKHLTQA